MDKREIYDSKGQKVEGLLISDLCEEAHSIAKKHGWWASEEDIRKRNPLEFAALVLTEIAEFVECCREDKPPQYFPHFSEKPEGRLIELADAVIRIADYCGAMGWDLDAAVRLKMEYNRQRPYRHGGKKF